MGIDPGGCMKLGRDMWAPRSYGHFPFPYGLSVMVFCCLLSRFWISFLAPELALDWTLLMLGWLGTFFRYDRVMIMERDITSAERT